MLPSVGPTPGLFLVDQSATPLRFRRFRNSHRRPPVPRSPPAGGFLTSCQHNPRAPGTSLPTTPRGSPMLELLVAYLSVLTPAMVAASVVTAGAALVPSASASRPRSWHSRWPFACRKPPASARACGSFTSAPVLGDRGRVTLSACPATAGPYGQGAKWPPTSPGVATPQRSVPGAFACPRRNPPITGLKNRTLPLRAGISRSSRWAVAFRTSHTRNRGNLPASGRRTVKSPARPANAGLPRFRNAAPGCHTLRWGAFPRPKVP